MDNLTHTVIGAIAGEALHRFLPGRDAPAGVRRRPLYLAAGMIGGNLPDLDLLYSFRGRSHGKLTYLLEHRGYTHTVVGCVLLALLLAAALAWVARRRAGSLPRAELGRLLGVTLLATGLHLVMDALNSYGVHPFWPLDNRWYYGDAVYIVEPWYWSAAAPLILLARSRVTRVLLVALQGLAVAATLLLGRVPLPCTLALLAASAFLYGACRLDPERRAAAGSAAAFVTVTLAFLLGSHAAQVRLQALAAAELPGGVPIDTVLSPLPANPLCWDALRLSLEGGRYVARRAVIALAPALIPAAACRDPAFEGAGPASGSAAAGSDAVALRWREFSMPVELLLALARRHCQAAAFLQFARAPYLIADGGGQLLGDLRFEGVRGAGFAQLRFPAVEAREPCTASAPWVAPRAALLP